ncbi:membrane protein insertase YidC [Exilibacterium tricleocarpae]|uniref:Membrane protein insertase YidC n=1 Tax=Exilibacterium tricleocarpae TaxID=2591008 RepID=A0A545TZS4_9GAMM|nr:membrane protein insertase YidC [Exilibacterium tricleocarpae]TQV82711.1 membrane protein insertase YidC [Exilibacterium tricleocarpae]
MDWQRNLLLLAMAAVTFMLFLEWDKFQQRRQPVPVAETTTLSSAPTALPTPAVDTPAAAASDLPSADDTSIERRPAATGAPLISVKTDSLDVLIDTHGGDIVKVALPRHMASLDTPDIPFELLNRTQSHIYVAESGLLGPNGTDTTAGRPVFNAAQTNYQLGDGEDELVVDLTLRHEQADIVKRFTFRRGDYLVGLEYLVDNRGDQPWRANLFGQIKRDSMQPPVSAGFGVQPFLGAALHTNEENYIKYSFDDIQDESVKASNTGGWVAMIQHYFLSAWIPNPDAQNSFSLRKSAGRDLYLMSFTSPQVEVPPATQGTLAASLYAGPKDVYRLEEISPYLDLTVDYGWLWWIAKPLFWVLNWIYGFVSSWGWSIIILTIIVKAIFFPLSATSYKSMAKMRKLQPQMMDLKERYGDNRQKMSEEVMKLYKKEGANPLSGCLPILIQMPVFIALYWVLLESVELRHTPFLGWIDDLSVKDPFFILPLIMGLTMWIQQKLNPAPPDPMQAKIMQMMPFVFTLMFMWFPAGLVLYWVVNNTLSIAQQYVITKQIEAGGT